MDQNQIEVLGVPQLGLKIRKLNLFVILARFEKFLQNLDKEEVINITSNERFITSSRDSFLSSF